MRNLPSEEEYADFVSEQERCECLFDLFELIAAQEALRVSRRPIGKLDYEKKISESGIVTAIHPDSIEWTVESGEKIDPIVLNQETCELLRVGDELSLSIGLRNKLWRVLMLDVIGNKFGGMHSVHFDEEFADDEEQQNW